MGRGRFFQGFIDWWKPPEDAPAENRRIDSEGKRVSAAGRVSGDAETLVSQPSRWTTKDMVAQQTKGSSSSRQCAEDLLKSVTEEELLEFLAADHEPVEADPVFKRRLREQLWAMIQEEKRPR